MQQLNQMDNGRNQLTQEMSMKNAKLISLRDAGNRNVTKTTIKSEKNLSELEAEVSKSAQKNREIDRKELENIAKAMEDFINSGEWDLKIQIHEKTNQTMVKIVSKSNGEVIREIPPENLLDLAAEMKEMVGVFVSNKV